MERRERGSHTREFKLEAVRLAYLGDKPKAPVARELDVRVNQLRQWHREFEEEAGNGVSKQELATAETDVGKLHREIAILREDEGSLPLRVNRCAVSWGYARGVSQSASVDLPGATHTPGRVRQTTDGNLRSAGTAQQFNRNVIVGQMTKFHSADGRHSPPRQ